MSFRRLGEIEFSFIFRRDIRRTLLVLGAPIAYLVLFGILYMQGTLKQLPIVVHDASQTKLSRMVVQGFADSDYFNIKHFVTTDEEANEALQKNEAVAAIIIPADFASVLQVKGSSILVLIDGSNMMNASTISNEAQDIVSHVSNTVGKEMLSRDVRQLPVQAASKIAPMEVRLRVLSNPWLNYSYFLVIGLAMAALQQGIFLAVGASFLQREQRRAYKKSYNLMHFMFWKLAPYGLLALMAFALTIFIAHYAFGIPLQAGWGELCMLATCFILAALGVAAIMASYCKTETMFIRCSITYTVPAFVLSGYTWPQSSFEPITNALAYTFPLTYFISNVRDLLLSGYIPHLYGNCGIMILFALAGVGLSYYRQLNKQLTRSFNGMDCN